MRSSRIASATRFPTAWMFSPLHFYFWLSLLCSISLLLYSLFLDRNHVMRFSRSLSVCTTKFVIPITLAFPPYVLIMHVNSSPVNSLRLWRPMVLYSPSNLVSIHPSAEWRCRTKNPPHYRNCPNPSIPHACSACVLGSRCPRCHLSHKSPSVHGS